MFRQLTSMVRRAVWAGSKPVVGPPSLNLDALSNTKSGRVHVESPMMLSRSYRKRRFQ